VILACALAALARAEIVPPGYHEQLSAAAKAEVERLRVEQGMDRAARFAEAWSATVADDGNVAYALGLAYRLEGRDRLARAALDRAIALDPELTAARYDRGELRLVDGDLDGAEEDFRVVVRRAPGQWAGHFRLADIAGRRGMAKQFESHLVEALRQGFSFRAVVGDPRWASYATDPVLGPRLQRLVEVYQDEQVLRDLITPPPGP
jgi:tetratricopeptide (TPR) repeat protein